jgi:putative transposase
VKVIKTYKYRLYPTASQERSLEATLETCRRWYNDCLAERRDAWQERQESVNVYAQLAKVKDLKRTNPYAAPIHSHVLQTVVQDLDKAFQSFFRRVRAGEAPGYPRFKSQNRFDSFGYKEYTNGFKIDGRRLRLFGIGRIPVRWHRPISGKIKTLRIVRRAGKWYACFACEVEPAPLVSTGQEVGVDVGLHHLLVTSAGETVENPRWYRVEQAGLRVLQRRVARRKLGGANRCKAVRALQRRHERIANRRKDFLYKLAHKLVSRYDRIALEDLDVSAMVHNPRLSKSILDAGWSTLVVHLTRKAAEAGRVVFLVSPAYTSKTCSQCGALFEQLTLADRWVRCDCGLSLDRDHNAALNILYRAGHARWGLT